MKKTSPSLSLFRLGTIHVALGLALALAISMLKGPQPAASFAIGSGIMLTNFLLLAWIWSRLIAKKSIAWTTVIIVIKYTVLLGAIYFLTQAAWFHVLSAGLGMASFVLAALIQAAILNRE